MTCSTASENVADVTFGSCIDFDMTYTDAAGVAEDITSDTLTVTEYCPAVLVNVVITKPNPTAGVAHLHLEDNFAASLNMGKANRLRISRVTNAGHTDNSEIIWFNVI